jgi:uncharacterized protein (DUF3820 family)
MRRHHQSIPLAHRRQRREHWAASALATFPLSFGRYRNKPLAEIPQSYLRWALTANVPDADRWAVQQFLQTTAMPRRRRPGRRPVIETRDTGVGS